MKSKGMGQNTKAKEEAKEGRFTEALIVGILRKMCRPPESSS